MDRMVNHNLAIALFNDSKICFAYLEIMLKYIPVKPEDLHGTYLNLNRLFSFKCRVFGVIGAREYGKTYPIKKLVSKDFIFDNKKFVVIRDTVDACEKLAQDGGHKFFDDIFTFESCFKNHSYKIEGLSISLDNKLAGEIIPMSTYYKYKGNYYDADNIFFDEFIPEKIQAYRGNRARYFVNTIETIIRFRPKARVIMTANALDLGDDILELLGIHIKNNQFGYYINTDKKVVIYYAPNSKEFEERKNKSLAGTLVKNSFLDANFNKNEFENGNCQIFERRKKCELYGIYYNQENDCVRLYKAHDGIEYYVCKDINPNTCNYMRYVFTTKQLTVGRKFADSNIVKFLHNLLVTNKVKFESKYLFGIYCSIINKTLKK